MALKDALSLIAAGIANLKEPMNPVLYRQYGLPVIAHQPAAGDAHIGHPGCGCHTLVATSFKPTLTPEEQARESIDAMLMAAGWLIQNRTDANIDAGRGVAIREFALGHGFGEADYLLFVDGQAAGVVEAKREGSTLVGVEIQTQKYSEGIPAALQGRRISNSQ